MQDDLKILTRIAKDLRVMIIADDEALIVNIRSLLDPYFDEITFVSTAEQAMALYSPAKFAIVYIDLDLPGMGTMELIRNICHQDSHQKVIVFLEQHSIMQMLDLYELGVLFYVIKPLLSTYFFHVTYDVIRIVLPDQYVEEQVKEFHKKLQDITEENEVHCNLLMQQSKLIQTGEMLSMIAHQWRQPLSVITAIIATLRTRIELDIYKSAENPYAALESELVGSFIRIEEAADYLSKTVNDFRNFYRPVNTKNTFKVSEVIHSVCRMVIPDQHYLNIDLQFDIDNSIVITSFENELKQVLINIINNAKDAFCEKNIENPKLRITLRKNDKLIFISITDNAKGIPESIIEKIFLPYFSTKSTKNGTGIGLDMSKTIIERHIGGKLSVQNDAEFGGADFCIEIPMYPNEGGKNDNG